MTSKKDRSWWSRFLRYWLDPIYYYLNLKAPPENLDGISDSGFAKRKPSLSRIMLLGGFIHAISTMTYITIYMFGPLAIGQLRPAVSIAYLAFSALCYSLIFGYRGYRLWLEHKGGGLDTALNTEAANRAAVEKVEADFVAKMLEYADKMDTKVPENITASVITGDKVVSSEDG